MSNWLDYWAWRLLWGRPAYAVYSKLVNSTNFTLNRIAGWMRWNVMRCAFCRKTFRHCTCVPF